MTVGISNGSTIASGREDEGEPTVSCPKPHFINIILELDCASRSTDRGPSVSVRWPCENGAKACAGLHVI
jgi:hypothetical protein